MKTGIMLLVFALWASPVLGASPEELVLAYAALAGKANPGFAGFSPDRGKKFYFSGHRIEDGAELSCASCHFSAGHRSIGSVSVVCPVQPSARGRAHRAPPHRRRPYVGRHGRGRHVAVEARHRDLHPGPERRRLVLLGSRDLGRWKDLRHGRRANAIRSDPGRGLA